MKSTVIEVSVQIEAQQRLEEAARASSYAYWKAAVRQRRSIAKTLLSFVTHDSSIRIARVKFDMDTPFKT
jgi:hypothetical protein